MKTQYSIDGRIIAGFYGPKAHRMENWEIDHSMSFKVHRCREKQGCEYDRDALLSTLKRAVELRNRFIKDGIPVVTVIDISTATKLARLPVLASYWNVPRRCALGTRAALTLRPGKTMGGFVSLAREEADGVAGFLTKNFKTEDEVVDEFVRASRAIQQFSGWRRA